MTCHCTGACMRPGGGCGGQIGYPRPGDDVAFDRPGYVFGSPVQFGPVSDPTACAPTLFPQSVIVEHFGQPRLVGTCSLCSGPVYRNSVWVSDGTGQPDPAWCGSCGATERRKDYGPTIPMVKP